MTKYPYIAGEESTSLSDYPGELATVFFTAGCNMNCPYCHNHQLRNTSLKTTEQPDLNILDKNPLTNAAVITGGEPTVYKDKLVNLFKKIKEKNYKTKLDTNGYHTPTIKKLVDKNLVDYIAMDIKTSSEKYSETKHFGEYTKKHVKQAMVNVRKAPRYEFRTTTFHPTTTEKEINQIQENLLKTKDTYYIQPVNKKTSPQKTKPIPLSKLNKLVNQRKKTFLRTP